MRKMTSEVGILCLALTLTTTAAVAQANNPAPPQAPQDSSQVRPTYVLAANDQMIIRAVDADEINGKLFKVDPDGTITLPLIGNIKAAGFTVRALELDITERLKPLVLNPQVTIVVTQYRLPPVFFLGAFSKPGLYPLEGRQTLVDMLIKVGGLQANASRQIKLTRRLEVGPIPLPGAMEDLDQKVSSVDISIASLSDSVNPAEDIELAPYDIVTASRAEKIYLQGGGIKSGTLDLDERASVSVLQAISLSGGFMPDADPSKALILRPVLNTARRAAIPLDLKRVVAAETNDYPLLPNDVLFVPTHKSAHANIGQVVLKVFPIALSLFFVIINRIL
jgi:polysaccharide biosynthesis/export protein